MAGQSTRRRVDPVLPVTCKLECLAGTPMRLRCLKVDNFRAYSKPTSIRLGPLTSLIGRNDVGKSTLLDALEVFFNGTKLDGDDAHIGRRGALTRISCEFDDLPPAVVIDAQARTTFADEHLLNEAGHLEIVKEFDLTAAKASSKVHARARHPSAHGVDDLLQLSNAKLKERALHLGVDPAGVDQRINTELRRAIWAQADLDLQERQIPLNDEDAKKVWDLLQKEIPTFALFRADRQSRDDDAEVANPMDIAIKEAVKAVEAQIDEIKEEVRKRVEEVARRTLAKLREMDASIADALRPVFKADPKLTGLKLSLNDHDDIPINKRGSGVLRLILLNFFRAEAERRQQTANSPGIIFAVEEPESSQHPSNQKMLINALLDLSNTSNTQVIITTHVPGIASLVPPESVRYVCRDGEKHPYIMEGDDNVLRLVAEELGVLPDKRVQLFIYVEGPNDVAFLEHLSHVMGHLDLASDPASPLW
jgi:putative ATP-dependent endonuclease of the OLD family